MGGACTCHSRLTESVRLEEVWGPRSLGTPPPYLTRRAAPIQTGGFLPPTILVTGFNCGTAGPAFRDAHPGTCVER